MIKKLKFVLFLTKTKRTLKKSILLIVILLLSNFIFSQQFQITGKIVDEKNNPIDFAEVLVLNQDSVIVKSEISDNQGLFSIKASRGDYIVQVKHLKDILYSKGISIQNHINLGNIKVDKVQEIKEVFIEGKKKLIERKVDRIIYNVSNDIFNKGTNLMDALHRAPRLNVENDNISIIGKGGNVKVMIDGRLQNLSDDALKAKLKGLRAEQIKRVEIIPTPPSKYSAEGNSGMINIILKNDENEGLQGSANTGLGIQFERVSTDQGLNLNYKMKKLDVSVNVNHNDGKATNENNQTYDFENTRTNIKALSDFYSKGTSANTVIQYKPIEKLTIGSTIDVGESSIGINNPSTTEYFNKLSQKIDSLMYSDNHNNSKYKSQAISIFSDYVLDSLGKKISLTYNYSYNKNISNSYSNSDIYGLAYRNVNFTNDGDNRYKINNVLIDFELPLSFGKLETGGAYTQINNNTSITYFDSNNNIDYSQSNRFEYTEKTLAAYISFQKDWSKKWSSKLGLRFENTDIQGYSPTLQITNKNNYAKLFPTLFVSYNPNDNHSFSVSYSKRLDRPSFYDLNPFRYYSDAYNYISGNPSLLPTYTNALELSYTLKNNLNFIAYGNYITDGISYLNELDAKNAFVSHPVNNYTQKKAGLIGSYTWKVFKWNSLYIAADGYYTDLTSKKDVQKIEGFGGSFSLRSSIQLNKSKTSFLELNYKNYLPSKAMFLDLSTKNQARFGVNFKQMFLNKNLIFDLWINDIFRQNIRKSEKQYNTFHYSQYSDSHNKGIYLSVNYIFGNKNVEGVYRDNKNVDKDRGGK